MRFEFDWVSGSTKGSLKLHESENYACMSTSPHGKNAPLTYCNGCGSMGLNHNPNNTTKVPCAILVDVNGDRKPTPGNVNCRDSACAKTDNAYKVPLPGEKKIKDIFTILITEDRAIPYGVTAQKAMYNSQK
ncbi:MAG: hypothetical protein Q4F80_07915 [bacterium]|nr:hypothetical protein [bacterium]